MRWNDKPSLSGWIEEEHEVERFYNLCKVQVESRQYFPEFGLDWDFFMSPQMTFSVGSFVSYMTQQAGKQGICALDIKAKIDDKHTLKINAKLQGLRKDVNGAVMASITA